MAMFLRWCWPSWVYIPRMFLGWWVEWIVVDRVGKDIREYYNNMYTPLEL